MEIIDQQVLDTQSFTSILAEPAKVNAQNMPSLEAMSEQFPYCQAIHFLMCKSATTGNEATKNTLMARAATYAPDGTILYNIVHDNLVSFDWVQAPAQAVKENIVPSVEHKEETIAVEQPIVTEEPHLESTVVHPHEAKEEEVTVEDAAVTDETTALHQPEEVHPNDHVEELAYEEVNETDETDKLIMSTIASADFFTFENKLAQKQEEEHSPQQHEDKDTLIFTPEPPQQQTPHEPKAGDTAQHTEEHQLSMYDDDKMPYTFLWWLYKTRKEHQHSYQPYAMVNKAKQSSVKKSSGDPLQHQYVEHIFHVRSPLESNNNAETQTIAFDLKRKEDEIIEKFIKEDPQLKPPQADKIDNENKAKSSAEDNYDLVSETLAQIYIDQVLYHKAIDTYKKLSLKYPEKSRYFADLIVSLERKLN